MIKYTYKFRIYILMIVFIVVLITYHNAQITHYTSMIKNSNQAADIMKLEYQKLSGYNQALTEYLNRYPDIDIQDTYDVEILEHSNVKAYMDYRTITSVNSYQYDIIYNSGLLKINDDGYLMDVDGYIAVAMTEYFGDIGNRYIIELETGQLIKVVKVDEKAPIDSSPNGFEHINGGGVIEFIIDSSKMEQFRSLNGYIHGGNFNNVEKFYGEIMNIYYIDNLYMEG